MASAIVDGLLASGTPAADLSCYSVSGESATTLANRTGINRSASLQDLTVEADLMIVAFKPQHLAQADPAFAELTRGKIVLSVLAAKTLDHLAAVFPDARNIIRTMPNTPSAIGAGITGWCSRTELHTADRELVVKTLSAIGREMEVPEDKIDALMGVSGCGPAFLFEFTGALRDAGVAAGLTDEEAEKLAIETVLGSARLMARSTLTPEELRDQVTSPNGTTFAGLQVLKAKGFRDTMREVVAAAKARSEELAQG